MGFVRISPLTGHVNRTKIQYVIVVVASADKTGKTVKDFIGLPFDTPPLNSGFNRDEPMQFAGRIHDMIKLCPSIDMSECGAKAKCEKDVESGGGYARSGLRLEELTTFGNPAQDTIMLGPDKCG